MKTTTILIDNKDLTAFKGACLELDIKIINEVIYCKYSKHIEIEYLNESSLFYLGQLTQLFSQSKFSLQ